MPKSIRAPVIPGVNISPSNHEMGIKNKLQIDHIATLFDMWKLDSMNDSSHILRHLVFDYAQCTHADPTQPPNPPSTIGVRASSFEIWTSGIGNSQSFNI